ncbi:MAG: hydrolase [Chitinophagales bacterium]|nr:hydrolase [Bacteroidota bacterium]
MKTLGLIQTDSTALLVIDIQERLMPVVQDKEQVFLNTNRLIKAAQQLKIPTIITEQYPNGLGHTCTEIEISEPTQVIEKICFSCIQSEQVMETLKNKNIKSLIICGVEAHICVLKTALEAMNIGIEVHIVADAVSSRTKDNKNYALERMKQSGAFIVSTEMILFQLIDKAGTDTFKFISKLIK